MKLYRGICINCNELSEIALGDKDITLNYDAIIDENGNKTVKDGNEYGIYMSDNKIMVNNTYGDIHSIGYPISNVTFGKRKFVEQKICTPRISVIYEIDGDKVINLRKPMITEQLDGVYNNGFEGNEWICDKIPNGAYSISKIRIGYDTLFDKEEIDVEGLNKTQIIEKIGKVISKRENSLMLTCKIIEKIEPSRRDVLDSKFLKILFGKNGIYFLDKNELKCDNDKDKISVLLKEEIQNENCDFDIVFYLINRLENLGKSVNNITLIENIQKQLGFFDKQIERLSNENLDNQAKIDKILKQKESFNKLLKKAQSLGTGEYEMQETERE